jgi:hypothetical protein
VSVFVRQNLRELTYSIIGSRSEQPPSVRWTMIWREGRGRRGKPGVQVFSNVPRRPARYVDVTSSSESLFDIVPCKRIWSGVVQ